MAMNAQYFNNSFLNASNSVAVKETAFILLSRLFFAVVSRSKYSSLDSFSKVLFEREVRIEMVTSKPGSLLSNDLIFSKRSSLKSDAFTENRVLMAHVFTKFSNNY